MIKTKAINKRTGKPFNDDSNRLIDWTDKHLKERLKSALEAIVVNDCFGVSDCLCEVGCTNELVARGYDVDYDEDVRPRLTITKSDVDEK